MLNKLFKGSLMARLLDVFLEKHAEKPEYSREDLSVIAETHYVSTSICIQQLEKIGILKVSCRVGRKKFYCLNYDDHMVKSFIIIYEGLKAK